MPLAAPPTAPNRADPTTFRERMDTFLAWMVTIFTSGLGYGTGSGGQVAQITSRTTGVTINKICGTITMFSAAGSATWASFTMTNSMIEAGDVIILNQRSGTNVYNFSAKVAAGSVVISFQTTGGTAVESPVINFAIIKATNS